MTNIHILSREPHLSQIITGYIMLNKKQCRFYDDSGAELYPYHSAFVLVEYQGKTLIYDMLDGYQYPEMIQYYLNNSDFYFKRSYSNAENHKLNLKNVQRMYPLGFNYHVSYRGHFLDKPNWKENIKRCLRIENNQYSSTYFTPQRFETIPSYKTQKIKVLFMTRLWTGEKQINDMRIMLIRELKRLTGIEFIGGIADTGPARELAPELIVPNALTNRKYYVKTMRKCDICIGTTGLHGSIGWKTGEYVAASKAIIHEKMMYTVPGDFSDGKNYLSFSTCEECLNALGMLINDPQKMFEMKCANEKYYLEYLRPDVMIRNTLKIVNSAI